MPNLKHNYNYLYFQHSSLSNVENVKQNNNILKYLHEIDLVINFYAENKRFNIADPVYNHSLGHQTFI